MSSPALILLLLFMGIPILLTFGLSFTNARLISPNPPSFVGLANFERALGADPTFLRSLTNTAFFALIVVPCQSGLALALAILVNQKVKGVTAFRTMIFMPVVTSMVVVSILWSFFYEDDGLVNSMLNTITGGGWTAVAWLNNPGTAMPAIIVLSIWQAVGLHMIIWLSGLQGIDPALYEAADLDGVNGWQRFRYVTWPGLRSTMVFILVTITIAALGLFVQVDVMTSGGSAGRDLNTRLPRRAQGLPRAGHGLRKRDLADLLRLRPPHQPYPALADQGEGLTWLRILSRLTN